jgi:hypothetical protein
MNHFFQKNLKWLFTGSFTMVLAACYGMPVDMQTNYDVLATDTLNQAIPGLKMTLFNNGNQVSEDISDTDGKVYYSRLKEDAANNYTVKIEDIDGTENGGSFAASEIDIVAEQFSYTVKMKP